MKVRFIIGLTSARGYQSNIIFRTNNLKEYMFNIKVLMEVYEIYIYQLLNSNYSYIWRPFKAVNRSMLHCLAFGTTNYFFSRVIIYPF